MMQTADVAEYQRMVFRKQSHRRMSPLQYKDAGRNIHNLWKAAKAKVATVLQNCKKIKSNRGAGLRINMESAYITCVRISQTQTHQADQAKVTLLL